MDHAVADVLAEHGIQPSAQRVAVADYVLRTTEHPSAETVWSRVREGFPFLSRATVYNTLNLFVEKGLVRALVLAEGKVVFDPNVERHHHFIDESTGAATPAHAPLVALPALRGFSIDEGRLAWVSPPGTGGSGSRIEIIGWTSSGFGTVESVPAESLLVVR